MISPQDALYQETKCLVLQGLPLPWPFADLSAWAALNYRVRVLNAALETMPDNSQVARLTLVLDTEDELNQFTAGGVFLKTAQQRFTEELLALLASRSDPRLKDQRLLVVFTALESIARIEANERVTQRDLDGLQTKLHNPNLWQISRNYDSATFFFQTEAQVKAALNSDLLELYAQEYGHVASAYDDLNYLQRRPLDVYFDSKENFEKNYQGNWCDYYK
jgi:hypothetical protein